jgi:2,3-bisphosphoglycerate-dependent phosphoglycerate mutase
VLELVLVRHGQSEWNALDLFTGWEDVGLTAQGEEEARVAGRLLAAAEALPAVVHTSLLTRAVRTAELALFEAGLSWVPVRPHWRLNERHYGDLTGQNKEETARRHGAEQVKLWRRSYDVRPPALPPGDPRQRLEDPRYRDLPRSALPRTECLADVVERVVPYWQDTIVADLRAAGPQGRPVVVVAHGNSLRALRKLIEGIDDRAIVGLEIPTGVPFRYRFTDDFEVAEAAYLEGG